MHGEILRAPHRRAFGRRVAKRDVQVSTVRLTSRLVIRFAGALCLGPHALDTACVAKAGSIDTSFL